MHPASPLYRHGVQCLANASDVAIPAGCSSARTATLKVPDSIERGTCGHVLIEPTVVMTGYCPRALGTE
jgi:hypothetical protein